MSALLYFLLPYFLWLLTFILLKNIFLIAMFTSTGILGILTLVSFRDLLIFGDYKKGILYGVAAALALYIVFLGGDLITNSLNLSIYVDEVYLIVTGVSNNTVLSIGLMWIGFMEEIYWRGGVQSLVKKMGYKCPWIFSSILYMLVHVVTLNPVLILAALIVGLVMAKLVEIGGLYSSIAAHIIWLQLIMVFFPLR